MSRKIVFNCSRKQVQAELDRDVLPVIQAIYDDFNEEYGTTIPNPLNR